ncbi:DNA-binding transcriptional LysR family regulator [Bradyrhizobium sp. USDA 4501]
MLDNLTLDQIRTFVAIAESGSFRAAATKLARVQSAVSHAIANLEAELGLTLFDRSSHRPALTAEGKALLGNARDLLLRVDAMRARARGLGDGVESELSLVVDTLFPIAAAAARAWLISPIICRSCCRIRPRCRRAAASACSRRRSAG